MSQPAITVVVHYTKENSDQFTAALQAISEQTNRSFKIDILAELQFALPQPMADKLSDISVNIIQAGGETKGSKLNQSFKDASTPYILYLDNQATSIFLKQATIDLLILTLGRNQNTSMIYADYEIEENSILKEVHLLKHHIGRVRDNQDLGRVFLYTTSALKSAGYTDDKLQFNTLYDLNLKMAEQGKLVHLANRYAGSLYKVIAQGKGHNVFDYLLASKESQLEAEEVLKGHLRRIGANLEPGTHYSERPSAPEGNSLKASVIIPVNNRPNFIGAAIESVQVQTVKDVEVIVVVNGGPQDPTITEVERYIPGGDKYDAARPGVQLLVFDINNLGLCLNMGARKAKGQYYVQLDSDDRLKPDAVEKILAVYDEDPKIGMVIGSYEVWEQQDDGHITRMENLPVVTHDEWTEENGRNNLLRINGAGAPRSIPIQLIRNIGFSVNEEPFARNYGEDYNMVLTISERHRIGRVWDAIYEVIRHSGGTDHSIDQVTIDRNDEAKDFMRKEAIKRRIAMNKK